MSQTIVTFQLNTSTKTKLQTKARKSDQTLSQYLRGLVEQDLGLNKTKNPWLDLAGILTQEEADKMLKDIYSSRVNRSDEYWDNLVKKDDSEE